MAPLTDKEKALVMKLIEFVWEAGGVRSPQDALAIENLRLKLQIPPPTGEKA